MHECPICYENVATEATILTQCDHRFCCACYEKILGVRSQRQIARREPVKCPICRAPVQNDLGREVKSPMAERMRAASTAVVASVKGMLALTGGAPDDNGARCTMCGEAGHGETNCRLARFTTYLRTRRRKRCSDCGATGHRSSECGKDNAAGTMPTRVQINRLIEYRRELLENLLILQHVLDAADGRRPPVH